MSGVRMPAHLGAIVRLRMLLLALVLVMGYLLPYVVDPFILATATLALVYALFALSINLLAGYGGLISLGQAGVLAVSAYGVGFVAVRLQFGHVAQIVAGIVLGLLASALFGLMAMRTKGVYFLMVTLAQGMIVWGLAQSLAPVTGAENGLTGVYRPSFLSEDWQYYYVCLIVLVLCVVAMQVVIKSPFGLVLRGLRDSDIRLRMLGYNPTLCRLYGFVLSGFFAAVAGVLFAYNNEYVSPTVAEFNTSAQAVLMVILGGIGTMSGPVLGAFVIVFVQNVVSVDIDRWSTVMGLVFIVMVLFARRGVVGGISLAYARVKARRSAGKDRAAQAEQPLTEEVP